MWIFSGKNLKIIWLILNLGKLSADVIFSEFSERSRIQSELAYHKIRLQIVKKQAELYESLDMVVNDVSCEIKMLEEKKQKLTENEKLKSEIEAKNEKAKSDVEKLRKDKSDLETLQNSEKDLDHQLEELRLKVIISNFIIPAMSS